MKDIYTVLLRLRHVRTSVYLFLPLIFAGAGLFATPLVVHAGFGITPPYVINDRLTRGTSYEQRINLVRSDPLDDLKVTVTLNIPGATPWFSIDRGTEFIMPKGVTQLPMVVIVQVPTDAEYAAYKGTVRIRTSSANTASGGGVSLALGAQIDVDIKVVDKIYDFSVRQIKVADLEAGRQKWGLYFPGKIRFFMTVENTGNTSFGPTKVRFDIYDHNGEQLLESTENTNKIEKIPSFTIKEVLAELPTRLSAGSYVAKYTIYKNDEVAQQSQINLSISGLGAVAGYTGYGFDGLSLTDKLKVFGVIGLPILLLCVLFIALIIRTRRRRKRNKAYANQQKVQ